MSRPAGTTYGVQLVRGRVLELAPHPDHCEDETSLRRLTERIRGERPGALLAADLFSGAGGMSLGLRDAGLEVVLSADHDVEALATHAHHFGGMAVDWDLSEADNVARMAELIVENGIDVLAGGPPCQPFSKAGRSGIRYRVQHGMRDPHDQRRDLWRSFLEVVQLARPRAVVMENVPDIALDREVFILRSMVEELELDGYSVHTRIVEGRDCGVPQFRQRLILVALRDNAGFSWPAPQSRQVTVWNAIGDLPEVEGGWRPDSQRSGYAPYAGPQTTYQQMMREGVGPDLQDRVYDHVTRPVRDDDAVAFDHMDARTRYSELPEEVKRYRQDIFNDKYKRLDENDLSRTITAHISRDGYWYIHPRQSRTITVREAARLQSFPDHFRFAGPPTAAFRQIGNAVPPLMARFVGEAVVEALGAGTPPPPTSREVAARLSAWYARPDITVTPWHRAETRWQVVSAETLLHRVGGAEAGSLWGPLQRWRQPADTLEARTELLELASWIGREDRAGALLQLATEAVAEPGALERGDLDGSALPGLGPQIADLALVVVPSPGSEEPVIVGQPVLRLARRFFGTDSADDDQILDRQNQRSDGRIAAARLIGGGADARAAQLALLELATSVCTPRRPDCPSCPLVDLCGTGRTRAAGAVAPATTG